MAERLQTWARWAGWAGLAGVVAAEAVFVFAAPTWPRVRLILAFDLLGIALFVGAHFVAATTFPDDKGGPVG